MQKLLKACIVDDDFIYRFTKVKALEAIKLPMDIQTFKDGEEILNFLLAHLDKASELPDVIFLDIDMPVMDGFQFMEEYEKIEAKIARRIAIYMVSSSIDPVDVAKAHKISAISDYIVKPVSPERLKSICEALFDKKEG